MRDGTSDLQPRRLSAPFLFLGLGLVACGGSSGDGTEAADAPAETSETPAETPASVAMELPDGVTAEMVDQGRQIFSGAGICFTCHGQAGEGMPNLGANLTDGEWIHSDGSYEGIVATITDGVTAQKSTSGSPMVARGGTNLNDEQVAAAAAYVWTLSN
jgi:mono/diheme cytochrome c family protein